jgi:hypothetical protein
MSRAVIKVSTFIDFRESVRKWTGIPTVTTTLAQQSMGIKENYGEMTVTSCRSLSMSFF